MEDRESRHQNDAQDAQQPTFAPMQDIEFFAAMRDLVRSQYLWEWDESSEEARNVLAAIPEHVADSQNFRIVGDVDLEESVFEVTLWLEEPLAFSLVDVDLMVLESLGLDLGRCTVFARELSRQGLTYHILAFGDGRARQLGVNVIGPRMQQIRDLGRLVVPALHSFTA